MSTVLEMARRRKKAEREEELKPIIPDFDEPNADMPADDMTVGMNMLNQLFQVGVQRKQELEAVIGDEQRTGEWWIPNAVSGQYSGFEEKANYKYFKDTYPWLTASGERIGIDTTKVTEGYPDLESFLASIPHDSWQAFITDVEEMAEDGWIYKNEDTAQELREEAEAEWMKDNGWPDLVKAMRDSAADAYDGFLLSKVPQELVWEWCSVSGHYPEDQGDGSIWLDMDDLGKEAETQEWFLDQINEDEQGWEAVKTNAYNKGGLAAMDRALKDLAAHDSDIAYVYNQLSDADLWKIFLESFPNEPRHEGDPRWYWYQPDYFNREDEPETWWPGFQPPDTSPRHVPKGWALVGMMNAFTYLAEQPWWLTLLRNWKRRPPEGHPEFEFEALEQQPDPDDPEVFVRHGGGLREKMVYSDAKIEVFYSNDLQSLNWHLRRAGRPPMSPESLNSIRHDDIFIIVGKEPADLLGRDGKRELGIVYGDGVSDLTVWKSSFVDKTSVNVLLADPTYGRSIKRMLLQFYKERGSDDAAPVFLQVGGPRALRRAAARGQVDMNQWSSTLGLHYIKQKKYKLAVSAFGRDASTVTAKGVFLRFDTLNELADLFENSKAAREVFDQEIYYWFDGYPMPEVRDVTAFLTPKALQHIRTVMVNREVWYPDAGPDGQGALVVLTTPLLNEVDDATIIHWLDHPNEEDGDVFEDITDAIQQVGFRLIESVGTDEFYTAYIKAALGAFDGTDYKWVDHPIKKGVNMFQVFVPWKGIEDAFDKYYEDKNERWSGDLEQLVISAYYGSIDGPDVQTGMWDVKDAMAKSPGWIEEFMDPIYELEMPEQPEAPGQEQLPLGEGIDDPDAMPDMLSGVPSTLPKLLQKDLESYTRAWGVTFKDLKVEFEYDPARYGSLLKVSFKPEGAWVEREGVLAAHGWDQVCSHLTHRIVNAYTDRWAVMDGYFSDQAPYGYVCMIWPLHMRNDPDMPL